MADLHWTAYMTAFTAPVVAVVAAYIAWNQWRTARDKLRLDLFEKRAKVYEAAIDAVNSFYRDAGFTPETIEKHRIGTSGSQWLFGEEVQIHLKEFRTKIYEYEAYVAYLEVSEPGETDIQWVVGKQTTTKWFGQQPARIEALFMPYLSFRDLTGAGSGRSFRRMLARSRDGMKLISSRLSRHQS